MQEGSVPGYQDRLPLFPGGSCYPLSGDSMKKDERLDQLSVIFSVIGTPSEGDQTSIGQVSHALGFHHETHCSGTDLCTHFGF
jgi:mitogen-activated protein kinase 1/3